MMMCRVCAVFTGALLQHMQQRCVAAGMMVMLVGWLAGRVCLSSYLSTLSFLSTDRYVDVGRWVATFWVSPAGWAFLVIRQTERLTRLTPPTNTHQPPHPPTPYKPTCALVPTVRLALQPAKQQQQQCCSSFCVNFSCTRVPTRAWCGWKVWCGWVLTAGADRQTVCRDRHTPHPGVRACMPAALSRDGDSSRHNSPSSDVCSSVHTVTAVFHVLYRLRGRRVCVWASPQIESRLCVGLCA